MISINKALSVALIPALAVVLIASASAQNASDAATEARLNKLERENAELRQQMSEMPATLKREKAPPAAAKPPAPSSPPATVASTTTVFPSKLETRFQEEATKQWKVGINPNGGGFFLKSPDDNFRLRLSPVAGDIPARAFRLEACATVT